MISFVIYCTLAIAFQGAFAAPKKITTLPPPPSPKTASDEFLNQIDSIRKNIEKSIMDIVPSTKDVSKVLIDASQQFADTVEDITKSIKVYIKNQQGSVDSGLKEAFLKISQYISTLKQVTDGVPEKANELRDILSTQVQNIFSQIVHVQGAVQSNLKDAQDSVTSVAEKFYKDIIAAGTRLQDDIATAWQQKLKH